MDIFRFTSDILLLAGAIGATVYCVILSQRLKKFNDLENGVGGAIAVLSAQVDDMTKALLNARTMAQSSAMSLDGLTERAESASRRLELLVAALNDVPDEAQAKAQSVARQAQAKAAPAPAPAPAPEAQPEDEGVLFLSGRSRAGGRG